MKRFIFYAGVSVVVACFVGGFAVLFWLLSSVLLTKISEAEFSFFATALCLFLYVLLFLILAIGMVFLACFFVYRANIWYKKSARVFTVLRGNVTEGQTAPDVSPASYFAGGFPGFGYFFPGLSLPIMRNGSSLPFSRKQDPAPRDTQGGSPERGGDDNIRPFPGCQKHHRRGAGR
jgi:hypothetical protein